MLMLLRTPKALLTLTLVLSSILAWVQYRTYHRQQHQEVQQGLRVATATVEQTRERAGRLNKLLAKPPTTTRTSIEARLQQSLLRVRLAESRHRIAIHQLGSGRAAPGPRDMAQLLEAVPSAPTLAVIGLPIEGSYTTLSELEAFLTEILVDGHSLASLQIDAARFKARLDIYGRR
jgi:hypothetical protein